MTGYTNPHDESLAVYEVADPGDAKELGGIVEGRKYVPMNIAASTAETNTQDDPVRAFQWLALHAHELGASGTRAITFDTAFDVAGNTIVTLNSEGDICIFMSVRKSNVTGAPQYRWQLVTNDGATLS